jgi:hypothetical protein
VHPVEAAWHKFRNSDHYVLLTHSLQLCQSYLDCVGLKACPAEVAVP